MEGSRADDARSFLHIARLDGGSDEPVARRDEDESGHTSEWGSRLGLLLEQLSRRAHLRTDRLTDEALEVVEEAVGN
jgi:hypothetical protein